MAPIGTEWFYHPHTPGTTRSRFSLGTKTVLAGDRGERWLHTLGNRFAEPAAMVAPESLLHIVHPDAERWWFVGASGTVYESRAPTGPFVNSRGPAEPLLRVGAAASAIVGVTLRGLLVASLDGGNAWAPVGPSSGGYFADVAVDDQGRALALEVPERLWYAEAPALRFAPLQVAPLGVVAVDGIRGTLRVRGVLGDFRLNQEKRLEAAASANAPLDLIVPTPPLGPDAEALKEGRASFSEGVYQEVRQGEEGWDLLKGAWGSPLEAQPLPETKTCKLLKFAAFGPYAYFACGAASGSSTQGFTLFRSKDGGQTFHREPFLVAAQEPALKLAVTSSGRLVLSGACDQPGALSGCTPRGLFFVESPMKREVERGLKRAIISGLRGTAQVLVSSEDGSRVFAAGTRVKGNALALYISRDDGGSFEGVFADDAGDELQGARGRSSGAPVAASSGPSGGIALTLSGNAQERMLFFDRTGQLIARSSPPETARYMAGAGSSAIAWSDVTRRAFMTVDAGASWSDLGPLPANLCTPGERCAPMLACVSAGCVFANSLTRKGWAVPAQPAPTLLAPPDAQPLATERHVRTPISCTAEPGPFTPLPGAAYMPDASDAMRGETDWAVPGVNVPERSVELWHQQDNKLENRVLMQKPESPARYAFNVYAQIEGIAAIRYPLPTDGETRLRNIELAWANYFTKKITHRAVLPEAGGYLPGDFKKSEGYKLFEQAEPDFVSIADGGIFLRPHQSPKTRQITYYLDGEKIRQLPPVDWPKTTLEARLSTEMAVLGGELLPLLLENDGGLVVRARPSTNGFDFSAFTTGLLSAESSSLLQRRSVVYYQGQAAFYVHRQDAFGTLSEAWLFPFQASGAPVGSKVRVPTQLDLPDPPQSCSPNQRSNTPRTVSTLTGGTRHPVLITEGSEPLRTFLTGSAVLYGNMESPCVAAFDATRAGSDRAPKNEAALIAVSDQQGSWLFRRRPLESEHELGIEVKRLQCKFDRELPIPDDVYDSIGTKRALVAPVSPLP